MAVTASQIKALFSELASVDDTIVEAWLEVAEGHHNADAFGTKSDFALKALTAHLVTLHLRRQTGATGTGYQGPIQSRTVDRVSTTYAAPSVSGGLFGDAALASTNAGQLYLNTREGLFPCRVV